MFLGASLLSFACSDDAEPMAEYRCGNGIVETGNNEECDDGNDIPDDECDNSCLRNDAVAECGDGVRDAGEECDDGNKNDGDGCSAVCTQEGVCGDGTLDDGEECDYNANDTSACACTDACTFPAEGTACSDGDPCNGEETCDGAGGCQAGTALVCDDTKADTVDTCVTGTGCKALASTSGTPTAVQGNAAGGTQFLDDCPAGTALVGLNAEVGGSLDKVQVICGALEIDGTPTVTVGATSTPFPLRGNNANTPATVQCAANEVVVGFEGRAGALIDQLSLRCAQIVVTADAGTFTVSPGTTINTVGPIGGTGGAAFAATDCASGVASGAHIQAGNSVDGFGLLCADLTLD